MAICFSTLYQLPRPRLQPTLRFPTASTSPLLPLCFTFSGSASCTLGTLDAPVWSLGAVLVALGSAGLVPGLCEKAEGAKHPSISNIAANANRLRFMTHSLFPAIRALPASIIRARPNYARDFPVRLDALILNMVTP